MGPPLQPTPETMVPGEGQGRRSAGIDLQQLDVKHALGFILILHVAFSIGYTVPAFILSKIQAGGFNVVFTGVILMAYNALLYHLIHQSQQPFLYGSIMGATAIMAFLSLMTAVFWGQLSGCEPDYDWVEGYSCYDPAAMRTVAAFASLLFITETVLGIALVAWIEVLCPNYLSSGRIEPEEYRKQRESFIAAANSGSSQAATDGRGRYGGVRSKEADDTGERSPEVTVVLPSQHYQNAAAARRKG